MRSFLALLLCLLMVASAMASSGDWRGYEEGKLHVNVCAQDGEADEPRWCGPSLPVEVELEHPDGTVEFAAGTEGNPAVFHELADGEYTIRASPQGFGAGETVVQVAGRTWVELHVVSQPVSLDLQVVGADGAPAPSVHFEFDGLHHFNATLDSEGRFQEEVDSGFYWVWSRSEAVGGFGVLVDGTPQQWRLPEVSAAQISGQVTDAETGEPVEGAWVDFWSEPDDAYWRMPDEPQYDEQGFRLLQTDPWMNRETTTDAQGRYTLGIHAGWAEFHVGAVGYRDAWDDRRVADGDIVDFQLVPKPRPDAFLEGTVRGSDGEPISGYRLDIRSFDSHERVCITDVAHHDRYRDCTVAKDGERFSGEIFSGYTIFSVHPDRCRHECPQYTSFVQSRVVEPGETVVLDVTLDERPAPDATITGTVRDVNGTPLGGIDVQSNMPWGGGWYQNRTNPDGTFTLQVHAGSHEIEARDHRYYPWRGSVHVDSQGAGHVDIVLVVAKDGRYGGGPMDCYDCPMEIFDPMPPFRSEPPFMAEPTPVRSSESPREPERGNSSTELSGASDRSAAPGAGNGTGESGYVDIPALPVVAVLAALVFFARRR